MGIVPAGTANDFARAWDCQPRLAKRLGSRSKAPRDGSISAKRASRQRQVGFVNMAGCGFDAEVVRRTITAPRSGARCRTSLASCGR